MQTLQISDQAATHIHAMAQQEHITSAELIDRLVEKYRKEHELLADMIDSLPDLPTFKGSPLDIQKAMRDEWT
ncbi:MAG: hypothetical protein QX198_14360 [Methylococcaceae bacterium]